MWLKGCIGIGTGAGGFSSGPSLLSLSIGICVALGGISFSRGNMVGARGGCHVHFVLGVRCFNAWDGLTWGRTASFVRNATNGVQYCSGFEHQGSFARSMCRQGIQGFA
jgi:hypothetical protein